MNCNRHPRHKFKSCQRFRYLTEGLSASTLSEMMVVMVLSSILLLSLFEGFSMFGKWVKGAEKRLSGSVGIYRNYVLLESLFRASDSLKGAVPEMEFYRHGEVRAILKIDDSLMVVKVGEGKSDTLFSKLSRLRIVADESSPDRIDTLQFLNDATALQFGLSYNPEKITREKLQKIMKEQDDEN